MNPTDASDTIVQEITIKAPAERIFEALTNPDQRLKWWAARIGVRLFINRGSTNRVDSLIRCRNVIVTCCNARKTAHMSRFAVAQRRASPCYGAMKRSGPNERQRLLSVYIPQSAFRSPHFIEANSAH